MLDKILIFGDSIAYGKWDKKGGWVARLRRYIDIKYNLSGKNNLQVYNLGIPGEVAPRLAERFKFELEKRVIDPSDKVLVIIAVGVNDSNPNNWLSKKQTPENTFKKSLTEMIDIAKDHKYEVFLIGLLPADEEKTNGYFNNEFIKKYDSFIKDVSEISRVSHLSLFQDFNNENYLSTLVDGIHPNSEGHKMLSEKIITFLSENFKI